MKNQNFIRIFEYTFIRMLSKLTLSIESSVVKQAKIYASASGRSLSDIIEGFLNTVTTGSVPKSISPKSKSLLGTIHLPQGFDHKNVLSGILSEKHKL